VIGKLPYLSVAVRVYNGEGTLRRCLEAVHLSSYKDYEVIVVDDGSSDNTYSIARLYADAILKHSINQGLVVSCRTAFGAASGDIIVNIDADVVIRRDTLARIAEYFTDNPEVDALTGLLSKEHPHTDFFSQYKNLYRHFSFMTLPERITFLYGSLFAIRKENVALLSHYAGMAEDLFFGQCLNAHGKKIAFLNNLEVMHLKKYSATSFFRNDFITSFCCAKVFLKYKGWQQIAINSRKNYADSSLRQIISIIAVFGIVAGGAAFLLTNYKVFLAGTVCLFLVWVICNMNFLTFLSRERGFVFGLLSIPVTFMDQIIMLTGIMCGFTDMLLFRKISFQKR